MAAKENSKNYDLILYRLDQIDEKIDTITKYSRHYVTDERFEEFKQVVMQELRKKTFYNIINPIIASISTAIITFLIIEFLRRS